jgi:transposase-like protein
MFPRTARRSVMDPTTAFCPNQHCHARGHIGQDNIGIHARKEQRFICHECPKTFSARQGTVFSRLRTSAKTVVLVVTLLAHGCPVQAIVAAFGFDERTVAAWWARSGRQDQVVHEYLVEQPRDLGQVQADELRVKQQGGIVWMALAMRVKTRVWLGGEVRAQRDLPLIRRLIERVHRCAAHCPLLVCTDGLCTYIRAIRETLRDPMHTGKGGRPRLRPWRHVLIAQVVKRYERRRVVDTERRSVDGTPTRVETLRRRSQGAGGINTASIERLNATFRERLAPPGASRSGASASHPDAATWHVSDWDRVPLLHTARESPRRWGDDAGHGRWHHGSLLDRPGTAVVSCAAASLGTTEAAGASFAGTATPHRAMVLMTTVNCGAIHRIAYRRNAPFHF